ncbi:Uncharacterized protein TCM_042013 [Theobroma cacao]|uniref:Uncharacterized protein n=1 Tax=Theobroma cacao TaxID=3641 RepID=A0A061GXZ5_THECC|nr:Uncharacterized protein TCM_042013 [Theobroma cacao]
MHHFTDAQVTLTICISILAKMTLLSSKGNKRKPKCQKISFDPLLISNFHNSLHENKLFLNRRNLKGSKKKLLIKHEFSIKVLETKIKKLNARKAGL